MTPISGPMFDKEQVVRNAVLFCCCSIAFYFTTVQFIRYFKNEDSSVLSYREHVFHSKSQHQYPTYSICFEGSWKSKSDMSSLMIFIRCGVNNCLAKFGDEAPLNKSLQFHRTQCYSSFQNGRTELENFESTTDTVMIDVPELVAQRLRIIVYVHRGGQLMRHILTSNSPEAEVFHYSELEDLLLVNNKSQKGEITFSIGDVVILRNREDGTQKCSPSLLDEDQKWREVVAQQVGCIPIFWKSFFTHAKKWENESQLHK